MEHFIEDINPILSKGLEELCRKKPDNPLVHISSSIAIIGFSCGWLVGSSEITLKG
jgi:hypothetical protein